MNTTAGTSPSDPSILMKKKNTGANNQLELHPVLTSQTEILRLPSRGTNSPLLLQYPCKSLTSLYRVRKIYDKK